jgi:imidazolonepropionase-like amidohydrolase
LLALVSALGLAAVLSGLIATAAAAKDGPAPILIQNARIFDGMSETLIEGQDVLVENGMISKIGAGIAGPDGVHVIDAGGRVMTPGFIYMHEHIMMQASGPELLVADDRSTSRFSPHARHGSIWTVASRRSVMPRAIRSDFRMRSTLASSQGRASIRRAR